MKELLRIAEMVLECLNDDRSLTKATAADATITGYIYYGSTSTAASTGSSW